MRLYFPLLMAEAVGSCMWMTGSRRNGTQKALFLIGEAHYPPVGSRSGK